MTLYKAIQIIDMIIIARLSNTKQVNEAREAFNTLLKYAERGIQRRGRK
jgi:hypothetical protein